MDFLNDIKHAFLKANSAERIIYLNVVFFIAALIANSFVINWMALPESFDAFMNKPWTLVSYAFVHTRFLHLLSNLIVLYYIGNLFHDFFTGRQFLNVYFVGAIFSGLVFLAYNYFTGRNVMPLGGASAAITAVFVAISTKIPRYALHLRFIGSVELWVLAAIWVCLSIIGMSSTNSGGSIAHLAGALFGFVYAKQLEKGNDLGAWFNAFGDAFVNLFKPKSNRNLKTVHKSKKRVPRQTSDTKTTQRKIDDILDKISKSGYASLTKEEKEFLFRAGKK